MSRTRSRASSGRQMTGGIESRSGRSRAPRASAHRGRGATDAESRRAREARQDRRSSGQPPRPRRPPLDRIRAPRPPCQRVPQVAFTSFPNVGGRAGLAPIHRSVGLIERLRADLAGGASWRRRWRCGALRWAAAASRRSAREQPGCVSGRRMQRQWRKRRRGLSAVLRRRGARESC
jgi:hypothetical protein